VRLLHYLAKIHATFDDPSLVSRAGLVPVMALARRAAWVIWWNLCSAAPAGFVTRLRVKPQVSAMRPGTSRDMA
jgi:hypothetical protein